MDLCTQGATDGTIDLEMSELFRRREFLSTELLVATYGSDDDLSWAGLGRLFLRSGRYRKLGRPRFARPSYPLWCHPTVSRNSPQEFPEISAGGTTPHLLTTALA